MILPSFAKAKLAALVLICPVVALPLVMLGWAWRLFLTAARC